MKTLLEYDAVSGMVTDVNRQTVYIAIGAVGFTPEPTDQAPVEVGLETQSAELPKDKSLPEILEMIRQGLSAEDLVKLKNCGVI